MEKLFVNPIRTLLLGLVIAASALTVRAQVFSPPKNLSNTPGNSGSPQIVVDGRGNINVVWNDLTPGNLDIFFIRSTNLGTTFSTPLNLSNNSGTSFSPHMVVDSSGNINVVWTDMTPGNDDVFFSRSTDGGVTFSAPKNLSNNPGNSFNTGIAVDSSGNINVVWEDATPGNNEIFFSRSSNGGATFSPPQNISNDSGSSEGPVIALDNVGNINIVWADDTPGPMNHDIFFSHSTDGGATFSPPQNISNNSGNSLFPKIAVDSSGNINVVWEDVTPLNFNIFFSRSTNGGAAFSAPQNISNNPGSSDFPQIAVDSGGNINVVWQDNTPGLISSPFDILFSRSSDGTTFSTPKNLSNNAGGSFNAQIAVDSDGNINVVWEDNTPGNPEIFFSRSINDGTTFSTPQNLSNNTSSSTNPEIAVDNVGNINVIWIDHPLGNSDIFFSQFVIDDDSVFSQLNGGNTFNGNQTVNGMLTATSFTGNGAGLLGVNAATAATATNALSLGGVAASNYARLDIGNNFSGNQAVTGNVGVSGNLSATGSVTLGGPVTIGGGTGIKEHLSQTFALNVGTLTPSSCAPVVTVALSGASDGDSIALGVPNSLMAAGSGILNYAAWISAANAVTIRVCNLNVNGPKTDPVSGIIRVDVWKH
jgi:hypothetical protein